MSNRTFYALVALAFIMGAGAVQQALKAPVVPHVMTADETDRQVCAMFPTFCHKLGQDPNNALLRR
jgi:hypothetical protein